MSGFLCQQSLVYIIQFVIFNIISVLVFGIDYLMDIIKHLWIQTLIGFIIFIAVLQVLCYFQFNKTAWGILITAIVLNTLFYITVLVDPKIKQKVKEDMKKKEEKEKQD